MNKSAKYLIFIVAFALLLRLVFFTGADHSDSLVYYTYASQASKGIFEPTQNHFSSRIGIIYPQALIYKIFGVNDFDSNILPLLTSLAGIVLIFYLGKLLFNEKTGLIAAFLMSFFPLDVIFSTRLMPDFPAAFFAALTIFLFLKSEKKPHAGLYITTGISWGIAYLMKEMSALLIFFFIAYVIYKKRFDKKYIWIFVGLVPFILIEFLHAYLLSGNLLLRYSQIESEEVSYLLATYSNYFSFSGMISRLLFHWPYMMLHDIHYGFFFVFAIISVYYSVRKREESTDLLLIWAIPLMLYLNFGTLSTQKYVPIPVTVKFLSLIMFPVILLISHFLSSEDKIIKKIIMPSAIFILLLSSLGFIYMSDEREILKEIKFAYPFVKEQSKNIYTDERTSMVLGYLNGFNDENNIKPFNNFNLYSSGADKNIIVSLNDKHDIFILINNRMVKGSYEIYKDIKFPEEISNIPKTWQLVKEFGSGDKKIRIYYAK